jgi:hypothetical protein
MADEGEYGTKEYLDGRMMTDLRVEVKNAQRPNGCPPSSERARILGYDDPGFVNPQELLEEERCTSRLLYPFCHGVVGRQEFDVVRRRSDGYDGLPLYRVKKETQSSGR